MTERQAFLAFMERMVKEGGLLLSIAAAAFLALSLLSYDPRDPGWSHLGYQGEVQNAAGVAGAWLADFSFSILGISALLVPPMIAGRALLLLRESSTGVWMALPYGFLRLLGAALWITSTSVLATFHLADFWHPLPFSPGGLLGLSLGRELIVLFGLEGTSLLLVALMLLGISLFTGFSWVRLADRLGCFLLESGASLSAWVERRRRDRAALSTAKTEHQNRWNFNRRETMEARVVEHEAPEAARVQSASDTADQADAKPADAKTDTARLEPASEPSTKRDEPEWESLDPLLNFSALEEADWETPDSLASSSDASRATAVEAGTETEERQLRIVPLAQAHKTELPPDSDPEAGRTSRNPSTSPDAKPAMPRLSLLDAPEAIKSQGYSEQELESMSRMLEQKLSDFNVVAEVVEVNPGPVITRFEIQPAPGTKVSKVSNLAKDLARSMAVTSVRVVEVIAGKSVIGIEIPNDNREIVRLSEVLGSSIYHNAASALSLALGNDIAGNPVVVNLARMPHLLVAGTTGSGKSVGVNAMLLSLLFKATPDEVRLMMVDPKMLELSIYDGIPHLLTPVITDMKEAATGLRWCVAEMERRYRLMAKLGVRNLAGFNDKLREARARGEPLGDPLWNAEEAGPGEERPLLEPLPYIVVVVDEFADMMMIVGKKVEELIARIAQKARAAGIHLILATQRPSVDVITGLIKANIPTRIAFQVSSKIDSRTILDQPGAENLLGYGDMLYLPSGASMPTRVHGAFVDDDEVHRVVDAWKAWGPADFVEEILMENVDADLTSSGSAVSGGLLDEEQDALYDEAVAFVLKSRRASISAVQRKLKIGYNRAARMIETMEAAGVVSEAGHNGSREVLVPPPVEA